MINLDGGEVAKTFEIWQEEPKELALTQDEINLIKSFEYEVQKVQDTEGIIISAFYDKDELEKLRIQITIITKTNNNADYHTIEKLINIFQCRTRRIQFDVWFLEYLKYNSFLTPKILNGRFLNSGYLVFDRNEEIENIKKQLIGIPPHQNSLDITNIKEVSDKVIPKKYTKRTI